MSANLERSIGRIEGKLDMLIELHTKNDKRLAAVEKKLWWFSGVWALGALIASKLNLPLR
jgi:hypothetical protein